MSTDLTQDFFDDIGISYQHAYAHDTGLHNFIKAAMERLPSGASVLDIGCGTGYPVSSTLSERGFQVTGIDRSKVMIDICRSQVSKATFVQADMLKHKPSQAVHGIFSIFNTFALSRMETKELLSSFSKWLKYDAGWLFIGTIPADDYPGIQDKHYDDAEKLYANNVENHFMGEVVEVSLLSKYGWKVFLEEAGFRIVETTESNFKPQTGDNNDQERHYWIMAEKIN